jgi:hypothetical protein
MSEKKPLSARATRGSARAVKRALQKTRKGIREVPGPSPNPATNLLIAEIAVRSAGRLARRSAEKTLLRARIDPDQAAAIVEGRGAAHSMISTAVARIATRSIPGALLVAGGLFAKIVFDRSLSRRKARRKGDELIAERIEDAADD